MSPDLHDFERTQSAEPLERLLRTADPTGNGGACETSLIDLVLAACDVSEDAVEVDDLVDCAIQSGAAHVLPASRDPMLVRVDSLRSSAVDSLGSSSRAA